MYVFKRTDTPVGRLTLVGVGSRLAAITWEHDDPARVRLGPVREDESDPLLLETERQLRAYFAGTLRAFDIDLHFEGTPFQKRVWDALLAIPYGETRTYGQIAAQLGDRNASRAVGAANGKNPISIVAPCHRVVGASGALTGFAGGLAIKSRLLAHEAGAAF